MLQSNVASSAHVTVSTSVTSRAALSLCVFGPSSGAGLGSAPPFSVSPISAVWAIPIGSPLSHLAAEPFAFLFASPFVFPSSVTFSPELRANPEYLS